MLNKLTTVTIIMLLISLLSISAESYDSNLVLITDISTSPISIDFPPRDEQGYLLETSPEKDFIYVDEEAGLWFYISPTLQIEILRFTGIHRKKPVVWYEADIKSKDLSFQVFSADPANPSKKLLKPEDIALKHGVIYAQNGDFFAYRLRRNLNTGIVIRNGNIISKKTISKPSTKLPPLDELSLYDGFMDINYPGSISPEEYLTNKAYDVLAFGPIMINDGEFDERLFHKYNFNSQEPRSVIGMIAPGHYMGVYVESRNGRSHGAGLLFIAKRMLDKGCQLAFNLDGGQSAAMIFMGKPVMKNANYNNYTNTRSQQDIIGIGLLDFKE